MEPVGSSSGLTLAAIAMQTAPNAGQLSSYRQKRQFTVGVTSSISIEPVSHLGRVTSAFLIISEI
jgi:hypothetical protein